MFTTFYIYIEDFFWKKDSIYANFHILNCILFKFYFSTFPALFGCTPVFSLTFLILARLKPNASTVCPPFSRHRPRGAANLAERVPPPVPSPRFHPERRVGRSEEKISTPFIFTPQRVTPHRSHPSPPSSVTAAPLTPPHRDRRQLLSNLPHLQGASPPPPPRTRTRPCRAEPLSSRCAASCRPSVRTAPPRRRRRGGGKP